MTSFGDTVEFDLVPSAQYPSAVSQAITRASDRVALQAFGYRNCTPIFLSVNKDQPAGIGELVAGGCVGATFAASPIALLLSCR